MILLEFFEFNFQHSQPLGNVVAACFTSMHAPFIAL